MSPITTITMAQLPTDWLEERRIVVTRDRHEVRPSGKFNVEVKMRQGERWLLLGLPDKAPGFDTEADRDAVLAELQRPGPPNLKGEQKGGESV